MIFDATFDCSVVDAAVLDEAVDDEIENRTVRLKVHVAANDDWNLTRRKRRRRIEERTAISLACDPIQFGKN